MNVTQPITLNGSGVAGNGALESVFGNVSITGMVTLQTNATIGVDGGTLTQAVLANVIGTTGTDAQGTTGPLTQTGIIIGGGNLTKVGGGNLILTGANTYTGQTIIGTGAATGGVVSIASYFALGSILGGVVVNNNSTLKSIWYGTNTFADFAPYNLTLNGTGYVGLDLAGAFDATVSTFFQGNINVTSGSSIGVSSGFILSMAGVVVGNGISPRLALARWHS